MKKIFSKLLIIEVSCLIITVLLCIFSIYNIGNVQNSVTGEIIEQEVDTNSPASGWFLLGGLGIGAVADIGHAIMIGFAVLIIPGFLLLITAILQIIARLMQIGIEKHWKNITSKVLTYISIVLKFLVCFVLLFDVLSNLMIRKFVLVVALVLNIVFIVLFIKELSKIKKVIKKWIYHKCKKRK